MFDVGWSELLLIGIVALIVIGPEDLPRMFRALGRITAKARGMAREFSMAMDDAARSLGRGAATTLWRVHLPILRGSLLTAGLLVFVEVKTRSSGQFGPPETFVSARKKELFRLAATHLQEELDWRGDIRFDIVALTLLNSGFRIECFEDAFS